MNGKRAQPAAAKEAVDRTGPPTIHDVARRAGVSTSTVSRSLTGGPRVSAATRERVRRIAAEMAYHPSRSAQSLRSARTGTIGLLAPNMENPTAHEHLRAIVRAAFDAGYTVLVADGQDSAEIQEAELGRIRDYRVDGLILGRGILQVTPTLLEFVRAEIPVEPTLTESELVANMGGVVIPYVTESDPVGAIVGFRRMVDLGHANFAVFYLAERPARLPVSRVRMLASVLAEAGLDPPRLVPIARESMGDCVVEVQRLATSEDPPTAIVSANARLTPYVLEGVQSAGLRIPADVSILCFGDTQWNRAYNPPLSVVREDYDAAAKRALRALVARIEGRVIELPPPRPSEFVMRGSIGPAPLRPRTASARGRAPEKAT